MTKVYRIEIWNDEPKGRQCVATQRVEGEHEMLKQAHAALEGMPDGWRVVVIKLR